MRWSVAKPERIGPTAHLDLESVTLRPPRWVGLTPNFDARWAAVIVSRPGKWHPLFPYYSPGPVRRLRKVLSSSPRARISVCPADGWGVREDPSLPKKVAQRSLDEPLTPRSHAAEFVGKVLVQRRRHGLSGEVRSLPGRKGDSVLSRIVPCPTGARIHRLDEGECASPESTMGRTARGTQAARKGEWSPGI